MSYSFSNPTREVNGALQAVPTSLTAITAHTAALFEITIFNPTGGSINFTLSDGQGTPMYIENALPIDSGGFFQVVTRYGLIMTSGIKWQASGAGLTGGYRILATGAAE